MPIYNDLKELGNDPEKIQEEFDLICGGIPCQPFSVMVEKKVRKTIDTSGSTCLKLLNTKHPLGSLSKTLVASSTWHSTMYALTWKPKVTPRNRLLFQLAVSKLPTEETESGSSPKTWATPNTMDHLPQRSPEALRRQATTTRKGRTRPANLREQVNPETNRIWRTPDAHCDRGASSEERMKMKLEKGMPISLNDQVAHPNLMWHNTNDTGHNRTPECETDEVRQEIDEGRQGQPQSELSGQSSISGEHVANTEELSGNEHVNGHGEQGNGEQQGIQAQLGGESGYGAHFENKQWEFEPAVGRVANGIPNRVDRLKALGNAIVPQIIYHIGLAIHEEVDKPS